MQNVTEQIKERINIVDFLAGYIELKPAGGNFKALCPFHTEKTSSFMVSPAKQIYKCFGCGKGGDIFSFLQDYEGIEFKEALKILADRAGVSLPRYDPTPDNRRNRLLELLRLAADFYHLTLLKSQQAAPAREYLAKRGVKDLARDNFKLGYSLDDWRTLYDFLKKKKYRDDEILATGLIKRAQLRGQSSQNTYYDTFRGRLMFPIGDQYSRVVGFGGRILESVPDQPKYINTPQTEIYDKSRVLYGLDKAKDSIRANHSVVIVEGYMDVIGCHEVGISNVIAVSGTALTNDQLQIIKRFTTNIALAFDMDQAGVTAAMRTYQLAAAAGMNTQVVHLPSGKDPDELARKDPALLKQAIQDRMHIIDYCFNVEWHDLDIQNLSHKKHLRDVILPLIMDIPDPIERQHFLEKLAMIVGVAAAELIAEYAPTPKIRQKSAPVKPVAREEFDQTTLLLATAKNMLALMLAYPAQLPASSLPVCVLPTVWGELYKAVSGAYNKKNFDQANITVWKEQYRDEFTELSLLASKDYENLEASEVRREFSRLVGFLEQQIFCAMRDDLIRQIKLDQAAGQDEQVLVFSNKLDELEKNYG